MRRENSQNERWIVKEEKVCDSLAEDGTLEAQGFGGVEVRKTTIMVGAEEDRRLLHSLLEQKSQLSGSRPMEESTHKSNFGGNVGFGKAHVYGLGKKFTVTNLHTNQDLLVKMSQRKKKDFNRFSHT